MRQSAPQDPTRAVSIAIASGAVVATGMMFVPVGVLQGLIATDAPMGDFARALIAYATGAATLGGLSVFLLRDSGSDNGLPQPRETTDAKFAHYRVAIGNYLSTKLSRHKEVEEVRTLSDLSRFRSVNVKSDAPTPRPLIASQDLPNLEFVERQPIVLPAPTDPIFEPEYLEPQIADTAPPFSPPRRYDPTPDADPEISTIDMVAQLEAAVAVRSQKRALLDETGTALLSPMPDHSSDGADGPYPQHVVSIESHRPPLELVPSASVEDDDANTALAAALATLHRITASAR